MQGEGGRAIQWIAGQQRLTLVSSAERREIEPALVGATKVSYLASVTEV